MICSIVRNLRDAQVLCESPNLTIFPAKERVVCCPVEAENLWKCYRRPVNNLGSLDLDHTIFDE